MCPFSVRIRETASNSEQTTLELGLADESGSEEFELETFRRNADRDLQWTARPTYVHFQSCS